MSASVYSAPTPSSAKARAVAEWLLEEVKARRLDPIVSVEPAFEDVRLTVSPADTSVWRTWCNLLCCEDQFTSWHTGFVTAHGAWDGVHVVLVGVDTVSWAPAGAL